MRSEIAILQAVDISTALGGRKTKRKTWKISPGEECVRR